MTKKALDVQVGGDHYKNFAIQPVEFIERNGLGFLEGCVIKRLCRWESKNGIEDLEKAKHEIDLLIQLRTDGLSPEANPKLFRCENCGCAWDEDHRPGCPDYNLTSGSYSRHARSYSMNDHGRNVCCLCGAPWEPDHPLKCPKC